MYFINHIQILGHELRWLVVLAVTSSIKQRETYVSYVRITMY